jgi:ketosteroid isomerase-like protein
MEPEHPNVERTRRGFAAFRTDPAELARLIGADCVWRIPGSAPVCGEYRGRDAIFGLFRDTQRLTGGSYRVEPLWILGDDDRVVVAYRARGERPDGRSLDIEQLLVCRVEDGVWREVLALPTDQPAFEAFWS